MTAHKTEGPRRSLSVCLSVSQSVWFSIYLVILNCLTDFIEILEEGKLKKDNCAMSLMSVKKMIVINIAG